jgi:peroxiredoxin
MVPGIPRYGVWSNESEMKTLLMTACIMAILAPGLTYAIQAGDTAPDFSLNDQQGKLVTLDGMKGKIVFLSFWATWCPPCREELPDLEVLHRKYAANGFTVLGVSVDRSESALLRFLHEHPVSFPVMMDKKGDVAEAYRFSGLPTSFLVGRDGIVKYIHKGYGKDMFKLYENEIADMLGQSTQLDHGGKQ